MTDYSDENGFQSGQTSVFKFHLGCHSHSRVSVLPVEEFMYFSRQLTQNITRKGKIFLIVTVKISLQLKLFDV